MIIFPSIDPVVLKVGAVSVRWYSIAYILGIFIGWRCVCASFYRLDSKAKEDLLFWAVIGIVLGGRLGYIAFYNLGYYLAYPADIFKLWHGGMSFHGGMLGLILTMMRCAKKHNINILSLYDAIVLVAPLGLLFGRLANFINGELYGRPTDVSWAVLFPGAGPLSRHPTQLYEAFLEGLVLFIVMASTKKTLRDKPGQLSALFMILYASFRMLIEHFREPDPQIGYIGYFTMGQILSLPMMLFGVTLFFASARLSIGAAPNK
ncbi:prolipoprotein diacylglyceryl transferase [Rickettsiales bacterium]|nr:prolipoprotein diacylglyceryl transferase [Rickettsiales bacterium]